MIFKNEKGALVFLRQGETVCIEPWGKDSLRVRATMRNGFTDHRWALTETSETSPAEIHIWSDGFREGDGSVSQREYASITNGKIKAVINFVGIISFYKEKK